MHPVIRKTFGGLSTPYYLRHFLFGLAMAAMVLFMSTQGGRSMPLGLAVLAAVSTLLYPYARFVYESVVGFIMGNNVFFLPAVVMLFAKTLTMVLCWAFALFIAPLGLAWLYHHHTKAGH